MDQEVMETAAEQATGPFVVRWNRLVSTTNWEKGRIIAEWRQALEDAGAPVQEYSDEAWSRRVGTVSGQHVGRLRRVHERFGDVRQEYDGLYWSHFQAALDWPDAEMWLEGAVQSKWSVSQMRNQRWEAHGAAARDKPRDEDIVTAELDEDAGPAESVSRGLEGPNLDEGPDFGDEHDGASGPTDDVSIYPEEASVEPVRPFEDLPDLPADLSEALELFKLAVLRHKLAGWREVAADDVLAALDALKHMVLAPSE